MIWFPNCDYLLWKTSEFATRLRWAFAVIFQICHFATIEKIKFPSGHLDLGACRIDFFQQANFKVKTKIPLTAELLDLYRKSTFPLLAQEIFIEWEVNAGTNSKHGGCRQGMPKGSKLETRPLFFPFSKG